MPAYRSWSQAAHELLEREQILISRNGLRLLSREKHLPQALRRELQCVAALTSQQKLTVGQAQFVMANAPRYREWFGFARTLVDHRARERMATGQRWRRACALLGLVALMMLGVCNTPTHNSAPKSSWRTAKVSTPTLFWVGTSPAPTRSSHWEQRQSILCPLCLEMGACGSVGAGMPCRPRHTADCEQSDNCREYGDCTFDGWECRFDPDSEPGQKEPSHPRHEAQTKAPKLSSF